MKYLFKLIILLLLPILTFGQSTETLSDLLWNSVNSCYSRFEDMNDDGIPEFDKIDDAANGFLQISGSWPTCGCSCKATVGAYKNDKGEYTTLQSEDFLCSWRRKISSNKSLEDILPRGFGLQSFTSKDITEQIDYPIFFIDFEIPRIGTETKAKIELVPFGLKPDGNKLHCFEYMEKPTYENCKSEYRIKDISKDINEPTTLDFLIKGEFNQISKADYEVIEDAIGNDDSRFSSIKEIQNTLINLQEIYSIYSVLESTEIILGWDRHTSNFYIKEKIEKNEDLTFQEFLIKNKYWGASC
ncbi:MAG: hypothetical protein ACQETL_12990 [Bacteroidota bacterium]